MGTVTNGKKWVGACVNGKTVSGLAKNGVVFYRMPVSTYRRRIMVGDNLSNRTIFQDFPDGFYKSGMSSGQQFNLIESNNINIFEYYFGDSVSGTYEVYGGNRVDSKLLYRYDMFFGRTMIKKDVTTDTYLNATVTEVNENKTYRHLFIEDENIRPLQVGDKIVPGTKFYGVVPDEPNLNNMNTNIYDTNGNSIAYFNFSENAFVNELQVKTNQYSYTQMYSKSQFGLVNNSVLVSEVSYTIGDISDSQSNPNFKYLLVDTTTLGA